VSKQATAWEFYITETIHERLKMLHSKVCMDSSFIRIKEFIKYNNGCLCTMPYYKNGTVLVRNILEMLLKHNSIYYCTFSYLGFDKLSRRKTRDHALLVCFISYD